MEYNPGVPSTQPQSLIGLLEVEQYIDCYRKPNVPWRITFDNTTSTRPKDYGGPVVSSVRHLMKCNKDGNGKWVCRFQLPNSFSRADGRRLNAEG